MSSNVARQAFWGFTFMIIILCLVNAVSFRAVQSLVSTEKERAQTLLLVSTLQKVESELRDADAAQRGYLLTNDPKQLGPYEVSIENHAANFESLRNLTADNPETREAVDRLEVLVKKKQDDMAQGIEMRGRVGFDAAVQMILSGEGNQIMEAIRKELTNLIVGEKVRLQQRDQTVNKEVTVAKYAMLLGTAAAVIVTLLAGLMIRGTVRERDFAARQLETAHQGLEQKVLERTAELKAANDQLQNEITVRIEAESELRKHGHFQTAVLDSLDEGIVACDAQGQAVLVSDNTRKLLSLPDTDLPGDPKLWREYYQVYAMDGTTEIGTDISPFEKANRGESVRNAEVVIAPFNGPRRIVSLSAQPIIDDRNERLGAVIALRDVTDIKETDKARQAKETAEASNRAKSEFLSRMSHELRTPLNAILGFAQLMKMDTLTPDHTESVDQILRGGRHLLSLINEVLDISRIETGHLAISLEPVLLSEAVHESIALIAPIAADRGVAVQHAPCKFQDFYVRADRQRVKQVLVNLLSNAVKYNNQGGKVNVVCQQGSTADFLRIAVIDTGRGIAEENLHRLFTPFDRLNAESSGIEGTGLGLCLSKGFIGMMGGAMGVESVEGKGSTFWFELGITDPPEDNTVSSTVDGTANVINANASDAVVLYIEDNESNIRLVEQILAQRPGITLFCAKDGARGLQLATDHLPQLILLDLNLPDMHGSEVFRLLRQAPVTRHIPVVFLSADASPRQIKDLMAAGAQSYLTKPISVPDFLREIDSLTPASEQST